jgi:hypothetical protein
MTNKYINRWFAICICAATLASCAKTIDEKPTGTIDANRAFRNISDINLGIIGSYAVLGPNAITNNSLVSDETMLPTENTTGGNVATHRWQYDGSNGTVTQAFDENYIAIDRINRVLAAIDVVPASGSEVDLRERYRGELLAMRAYCHFELLRNFASKYEASALGAAYMTESVIGTPTRSSFGETMTKIKADLATAKDLIPTSFNDRTRITRNAVSAIQARAALYEKNWDDAISYSTEAINAVPLATQAQFADIWTDKSDAEVFWKLRRATGDSRLGDFYYNSGRIVLYAPAFKLLKLYDRTNDIRYAAYVRTSTRTDGSTRYWVGKYIGGTSTANLADVKLYRSAEMYLIRAEAQAEKNNISAAAADLNSLRAKRITGYADETFADKASIVNAIYAERFKELAFEGHRFFDLRRKNEAIVRDPEDAINTLGANKLETTAPQFVFPIPDSEIRVNKNMQQNPGY